MLRQGGNCLPSLHLMFMLAPLLQPHSSFMRSLLSIWHQLHGSLLQIPPCSQDKIDKQPFDWNNGVLDGESGQLGDISHIPWATWAAEPTRSLRSWWDIFWQMDTMTFLAMVDGPRVTETMREEIEEAIPLEWMLPPPHKTFSKR